MWFLFVCSLNAKKLFHPSRLTNREEPVTLCQGERIEVQSENTIGTSGSALKQATGFALTL